VSHTLPSCYPFLLPQAAVLSESEATLVLDHKARVVYATDKLATMLGYPVASLLKMELGALLPQPTCQLYKPWLSPVCACA
jgi:PAS domain-containing protein